MLDTSIKVKTDYFDGPLSLLLLLMQKEEMDIKNLDLNAITKQYLAYLAQIRELNFDRAGDYLYLAATLLLLKSKSCISEEDEMHLEELAGSDFNITSQAELIRRLEELEKYQKIAQGLWALPRLGQDIFVKPKVNRKAIINSILTGMDLDQLTLAMLEFMQKEKRKYSVIKRDRLSIKEKLEYLKEHLVLGKTTNMDKILADDVEDSSTINIVITFISLLELARLNKINIYQNELYGKVYVEVVEDLNKFDVNLADGFEEEEEEGDSNAGTANAEQLTEDSYARPAQLVDGLTPTDKIELSEIS